MLPVAHPRLARQRQQHVSARGGRPSAAGHTAPETQSASLAARLRQGIAVADVESASLVDEDRQDGGGCAAGGAAGTPPRTPTSGSVEPSVADMESANLTDVETQSSTVDPMEDASAVTYEQVLKQRWQCDLCFEPHGSNETPWRLGDEWCAHGFCRRCVHGSVQWGGRCPYDNAPIPPLVVCGVMGTLEYVYHEKRAEARRTGGIMCSTTDCPGVAPSVEGKTPRPVTCAECDLRHCGRVLCGTPWTAGHRCWDLVEEERRRGEQEVATWTLYRSLDARTLQTKRRLAVGPRFRPCPGCGAMVEHLGGCNIVYHEACRTRWCFACRRIGSCSDFDCQGPSSGPPTPRRRQPPLSGSAMLAARRTSPSRMAMQLLTSVVVLLAGYAALVGGLRVDTFLPRSKGFLNSSVAILSTCPPTLSCYSVAGVAPAAQVLAESVVAKDSGDVLDLAKGAGVSIAVTAVAREVGNVFALAKEAGDALAEGALPAVLAHADADGEAREAAPEAPVIFVKETVTFAKGLLHRNVPYGTLLEA